MQERVGIAVWKTKAKGNGRGRRDGVVGLQREGANRVGQGVAIGIFIFFNLILFIIGLYLSNINEHYLDKL